jgi:chromosome segregation ATPase
MMIAESTARIERDQLRQAAGTLADLQSKSAAALQDLAAATEARARLAPQLAEGERTIESQRSRVSELARTGDDLLGSVRQLEARLAETTEEVAKQQAELAALRDAVASEKQTLADLTCTLACVNTALSIPSVRWSCNRLDNGASGGV